MSPTTISPMSMRLSCTHMQACPARLLIADDDVAVRSVLTDFLGADYECQTVGSAEGALELLESGEYQIVLSDISMEGMSGLDLIPRVRELSPDLLALADGSQTSLVNVIIQQNVTPQTSLLDVVFSLVRLVTEVGGSVTGNFVRLGAVSARVPAKSLRELAASSEVRYVSPDRPLGAAGHVETPTGVSNVRTQTTSGLLGVLAGDANVRAQTTLAGGDETPCMR